MKRKIIKIASNTYVVSLPTKWLKDEQLTKGDELEVFVENEKLICTPSSKGETIKKINLDVKSMNPRVLRWAISSLHKQGWQEIIVHNYNKEQLTIIEQLINSLFIGFVIKEKHTKSITIGELARVDIKEFNASLRRAFRLVNQQIDELIKAFETKDEALLREQILHEENNNKLTNFCERLLNSNLAQKEKGHFWYVIAWNLEKISDNFKYIAKYFNGAIINISDDTMQIMKDLKQFIKEYYHFFYKFSFKELTRLAQEKEKLEKRLIKQLSNCSIRHESILVSYLHNTLLQMMDFSASTIAINYDGKEIEW